MATNPDDARAVDASIHDVSRVTRPIMMCHFRSGSRCAGPLCGNQMVRVQVKLYLYRQMSLAVRLSEEEDMATSIMLSGLKILIHMVAQPPSSPSSLSLRDILILILLLR
eukprot:1882799-Rhodomonas_salina.5